MSMDLSSRSGRGVSSRGETVGITWQRARRARSDEWVPRKLRAAERAAEVAAVRYRDLRAGTPAARERSGARGPLPTWQQLLLLIVGGGMLSGLLVMWLLATAYLGPAAMLALPAAAGLVMGFRSWRRRHPPAPSTPRRPLVADLVRATQELHDAEAVLQRVRDQHGSASDRPTALDQH
ncbi:MAG: hypothetical protein ACRDXB_12540 [Actinomycetes bacterium]